MARSRIANSKFNPSIFSYLLSLTPFSFLVSSPKKSQRAKKFLLPTTSLPLLFFSLLCFFVFSVILILSTVNITQNSDLCSVFTPVSSHLSSSPSSSSSSSRMLLASLAAIFSDDGDEGKPRLSVSEMVPLPAHGISGNLSKEESQFWKQPNNKGYQPCLDFGIDYRRESPVISSERRRFLVVVASGGLNQQRNQIIDAVVIARILKAALIIPILKVNFIWGDER